MNNLHKATDRLRGELIKMMKLVRKQIKLTHEAILSLDQEIVEEVLHREQRVNAWELQLDAECEQVIALYNPMAGDLRFVISVLSISSNLERIGDLAEGIVKYLKVMEEAYEPELIEKTQIPLAFETAISMMDDVWIGLKNKDSATLRKVFKKDDILDKINGELTDAVISLSVKKPKKMKEYLYLFSTVKKIERIGDLIENIAEDIIFYMDAEVLKHNN